MDTKLDPSRDDLPLMANTSHMLVKHYVLDLDVNFESQTIEGTIVLFFEDGNQVKKQTSSTEETCQLESSEACTFRAPEPCHIPATNARTVASKLGYNDFAICDKGEKDTFDKDGNHDNQEQASGISSSEYCCDTRNHGREGFLLVLDCCDLSVLKVEEVDVAAVPGIEKFTRSSKLSVISEELRNEVVGELVTLPADRWREQLDYYARCGQAPGCGELFFDTDTWSLQIRKPGALTASDFPHAIRIWYKTKPEGRSVAWTSDQSGRPCVYTVGSPINNRALFPCQEPPVAMSTWQATVRAAASFVVLMSGENSAKPTQLREGCSSWHYYVTMPMPAATLTIAVGCWTEIKLEKDLVTERPFSSSEANFRCAGVCGHVEYPCRFQNASATAQEVIPHRVFVPMCLRDVCQETLLPLIPPCLSAAHSVLGTHPFSRLDILIVPANFSSLGMASPHIIFLSQSTLTGMNHLCGMRLCHEIAHAWFGLAIGARDWTEEWLSEGFATHLEDVFWTKAQQLSPHEAQEQQELRACLRWRRLQDELRNSPEEMQVLRPSKEKTGQVSDSGASVVKHGLNPEKIFMQVHYLKGYFLLRFLAKRLGNETYFSFLRKFVHTFHGQLILSQDFLQMLLERIPEEKRQDLSVENIFRDWLESSGMPKPLQSESQAGAECGLVRQVSAEVTKWIRVNRRPRKRRRREKNEVFEKVQRLWPPGWNLSVSPESPLLPDQLVLLLEHLLEQKTLKPQTLQSLQRTYRLQEQDAEVRHRWCELVVKHRHAQAHRHVERFLLEDQAMGVYLYGELMVSEDARQQQLARRCFELAKVQMDGPSADVVAQMLF
ncbi:aminopeptidase O isoform X1 [Marmota monax]|uniref:aminopeptidase O isoform X1 n=1 Tax=Marmota monax TaxID=9995 RepID=UPI001EAFD48D|nr:aminopeptidase O isoform X1 [Marmota monax]XP_058441118.1 aminopeptidase O isoform X1 [Marmota monax]XP_058441119.1 aminopeptidase O isoform X1 [Marmota monax]